MADPRRRRERRTQRSHLDPLGHVELPDAAEPAARGRERFEAAIAPGPLAGARPGDEAIVLALAEAPVARMGELTYGSNAVFLLEYGTPDPSAPEQPLRAVYKPVRGERPLWDFPRHTLYLREVAAYLVDAALDLGRVPPTVLRDGPLGPGSVQLFVHGAEQRPGSAAADALEAELHDIAMLDVLVNNADRKRAHLMVGADMHMRAIDNALSFLPYPRQRTVLLALGGTTLPPATRDRLHALASDPGVLTPLRERLRLLLSGGEVEAFRFRVEELDADPVYPVLDDWDGRPFEWW